jgi:glycosyltransferase involved in cell wall biosynthesis
MEKTISFIIPSYNNLKHLKNAYESIKRNAPESEIILLDDGSTDGTRKWIESLIDPNVVKIYFDTRYGHTILYDIGIKEAKNDIVGILHADMIIAPNYVKNILKHLKPGTVVCATRIEPPLHPEGKEKIIKDFGLDFDSLNVNGFEIFSHMLQHEKENVNITTKGMFAPWVIYKKDFLVIGGHDPLFAPFPYEDSDIFQRWILKGYELIQSRDAFVYHLTCRGHRWNEQVGVDDDYYKVMSNISARNYIRKWGSWIKNDEYQYPIIIPKYNKVLIIENCTYQHLSLLEPWFDSIYLYNEDNNLKDTYINDEQKYTKYDLSSKILVYEGNITDDIVVKLNGNDLNQALYQLIQQLSEIIQLSGNIGHFELSKMTLTINKMKEYQNSLIYL